MFVKDDVFYCVLEDFPNTTLKGKMDSHLTEAKPSNYFLQCQTKKAIVYSENVNNYTGIVSCMSSPKKACFELSVSISAAPSQN